MIYFIVNKTARTGKCAKIWKKMMKTLDAEGIEYKYFYTEYAGHATVLAEAISDEQGDGGKVYLAVVGGDGTMNEVLNGISDFDKIVFGMIPIGSGNDFGRGLGLPDTPYECLKDIIEASRGNTELIRKVDLGQVEFQGEKKPHLFGISSGIGMDAIVCKRALTSKLKNALNKIHLGKLTYLLLTVHTLFSMETREISVRLYDKDKSQKDYTVKDKRMKKTIFAAVMNLKAEGGGVPMAPGATPYDGKLSMCCAYGIPKWRTFFCLPVLVAAKHEKLKGFEINDAHSIEINVSKPFVLHADGEYLGDVTYAKFTCLPEKLNMVIRGR